jgi:hypothetical protein
MKKTNTGRPSSTYILESVSGNSFIGSVAGASKTFIPRVDVRTCDDPKKIPYNKGTDGDWYKRGTNHRLIDGKIARDMGEDEVHQVEFSTLAELESLIGVLGCRLSVYRRPDGRLCIQVEDN